MTITEDHVTITEDHVTIIVRWVCFVWPNFHSLVEISTSFVLSPFVSSPCIYILKFLFLKLREWIKLYYKTIPNRTIQNLYSTATCTCMTDCMLCTCTCMYSITIAFTMLWVSLKGTISGTVNFSPCVQKKTYFSLSKSLHFKYF